jgi:hypothetical protein
MSETAFETLGWTMPQRAILADPLVADASRTLLNWWDHPASLRTEGHTEPRAMGGDHRSRLPEHRAAVAELLARQPDLS